MYCDDCKRVVFIPPMEMRAALTGSKLGTIFCEEVKSGIEEEIGTRRPCNGAFIEIPKEG